MAQTRAADDCGAFLPGPRLRLAPTGAGALSGLNLAVKDLFDVAGHVTGGGNPGWAEAGRPAAATAWAVAALCAEGAAITGMTVTDELAFSLEGRNAHYGTPVNPRDPSALPGGSSSGSAVAVAAGLADIGLGSDTGGSVRVPGAFCGLWAMRPTFGRIPVTGLLPFAPSYDTVGWFASSGKVLAAAGDVLLGRDAENRPITRLTFAEDACALADPDIGAAVRAAARVRGAAPVEAFATSWQDSTAAYSALQARDIRAALGPEIARREPRFGADIGQRFAAALAPDPQVPRHEAVREAERAHLARIVPPGCALIVPTVPMRRLAHDAGGNVLSDFYPRALALCAIAGHAGAPQIHLPLGDIGFSIIGSPGSDGALIDVVRTWNIM